MGERPRIAVIGAGPAGLMAAEVAVEAGAEVVVYDRMPSPGRKFLLAGRGGLNLTHTEEPAAFVARYADAAEALAPALARFGPEAMRRWCADLGIATFVGTSGRVFPASFKTSPLLRAWLRRLDRRGVGFRFRHRWNGWDETGPSFAAPDGPVVVEADATVLALGGASWPQLGGDGAWVETIGALGIDVAPLQPANCGYEIAWSAIFRDRFEGEPLKNVAVTLGPRSARGDLVVTRTGIEGGPIYALAGPIRDALCDGRAVVHIALRPDLTRDVLAARLARRQQKQSVSTWLRKTLGLAPVAIGLLHEARLERPLGALDTAALADLINAIPVPLRAPMPIARAISSAGGVRFAGLDAAFMLARHPGTFVAGEMLDWEAPTGGYLLQACFATGAMAGEGAVRWCRARALASRRRDGG